MPDDFWQQLRGAQDAALQQGDNVRIVRERMPSRAPAAGSRRRWSDVAGAIAVVATVVFAVMRLQVEQAPLSFEVGKEKARGHVGMWIAAPDGTDLPLRFSDGSSIDVARGSRARVTSLERTGGRLLLERGEAVANVVHREDTRWEIAAGPFQVSVLGTRFTVNWDPGREVLLLHLHEGQVLVSGAFLREPQSVSRGQTLRAFCKEGRSELVQLQSARDVNAPSSAKSDESLPSRVEAGTPGARTDARGLPPSEVTGARSSDPPRRQPWLDLAAAGRFREAVDSAEQIGFETECRRASGRDLLALGDAARLAKNSKRARQAYLAARDKLPGGGRATFGLGLLAFDHEHDLVEAAKWFEIYVAQHGSGGLRGEAQGRLIEAYQRTGNTDRARRIAERYLIEYPTGAHAALARQLTSR